MLERLFQLNAAGTTIRIEVLAGVTTFVTMAYIIFVQPAVLASAGMDHGAVLTATCLASAVATLLMALLANYPIAVAPAMGHNFFFAFTVVLAGGTPWPVALGAVAIAGMIFILTAGVGLRERVISAVPESLKHAISVGIGLLIALIGLQWAGIIVGARGTLVTLGPLTSPPVILALGTLVVMAILMARRVTGAMLIAMAMGLVAALAFGFVKFEGVVSSPPSLSPTFLKLDVLGALRPGLLRRRAGVLPARALRLDRHADRLDEPDRTRARRDVSARTTGAARRCRRHGRRRRSRARQLSPRTSRARRASPRAAARASPAS